MKYLVTGGAGFIGSHLIDALITRGDSVLALDDLSTGRAGNLEHFADHDQLEFIEGSVLDRDLVDDCMQSVDACAHLASAVGVELIVERPLDTLLSNVRGNDAVISAAAERGRKLLFTSTSEVYGKNSEPGLREDSDRVLGSPFKARWGYSIAKSFGEALAHSYHRERSAQVVVARLFNTVGPRQTGANGMVLPRFVRQALANEAVTVYGNGTQTRCFGHVLDTVHGLVLLLDSERANGGVYNIGTSTEIPIVELARKVIERAGSESTVRLVPYEKAYAEGYEELGCRTPDTSAIEALTGWTPTRTIDEAIDDAIAYERTLARPARSLPLAG